MNQVEKDPKFPAGRLAGRSRVCGIAISPDRVGPSGANILCFAKYSG